MATLLARGQITIAAIRDGKDGAQGKDYWQQDVWVDLSAAEYDRNVWYPVVGGALPYGGFVGIKVSVGLNSGTKPSWSTHSAGFSVDFHIDTQRRVGAKRLARQSYIQTITLGVRFHPSAIDS